MTSLEMWLEKEKEAIHPKCMDQALAVIEKLKEALEIYTCPHCSNVGDSDQCYEYQSCRALSEIDPEKL